jgi:hypothetical protein
MGFAADFRWNYGHGKNLVQQSETLGATDLREHERPPL